MKPGIFLTFDKPSQEMSVGEFYHNQFEMIQLAEEVGFHQAWIAEHHFLEASPSPSIMTLAAYLARITKRIRIGLGVAILPFYHPIRAAEDIATLDVLSGGRIDVGIGKGGPFKVQNDSFDIPMETSREAMKESMEVVLRAWEKGGLRQGLEYDNFAPDYDVFPKPLQNPHPPIYVACAHEESIRYAAKKGYSIITPTKQPVDELKKNLQLYRDHSRQFHGEVRGKTKVFRTVYVADTMEAALTDAEPALYWVRKKLQRYREMNNPQLHFQSMVNCIGALKEDDSWKKPFIIGDPDSCIEQIHHLNEELGTDDLVINIPPVNHKKGMEALRLFANKVMPTIY